MARADVALALAVSAIDADKVAAGDYKDSTVGPFMAALEEARQILKNPAATTAELNAAREKLAAASAGLVLKLENTITAKGKTVKVKASKLRKKSQRVSVKKALAISNAQGTVTYKKIKGNKKIVINKKTGRITVKKGLRKGTYKIKVQITAAGNADYMGATLTKTVTVKVRR